MHMLYALSSPLWQQQDSFSCRALLFAQWLIHGGKGKRQHPQPCLGLAAPATPGSGFLIQDRSLEEKTWELELGTHTA